MDPMNKHGLRHWQLGTFTLIEIIEAPLEITYVSFFNIKKNYTKKSLNFSYDPTRCCVILLCEDMFKNLLKTISFSIHF
jgi:hypothetical protein